VLRRLIWLVVALPVALLLVTLALANRHPVRLVLDPFRPADPTVSVVLPFYYYLFGMLLVGVVIGGTVVWLKQARWRRNARQRATEASRWQAEATRLTRERDRELEASRQLAPVNR
jgi:uncharacterized integral membrane protein